MLEKKDKRFIKNWRPISLLNIDKKSPRKVLPIRIKNVLPFLISSNQTASKSVGVILDILEIANTLALKGFLVTVDIEKYLVLLITASYYKFYKNSNQG